MHLDELNSSFDSYEPSEAQTAKVLEVLQIDDLLQLLSVYMEACTQTCPCMYMTRGSLCAVCSGITGSCHTHLGTVAPNSSPQICTASLCSSCLPGSFRLDIPYSLFPMGDGDFVSFEHSSLSTRTEF